MAGHLGDSALGRVASMAYPSRFATPETLELSRACLARDDLDMAVRRAVVDAQAELEQVVASRARYGA